MKADVTISNIYWNKGLANFFFREQSMETLEALVNNVSVSNEDALETIEEEAEVNEWSLDDVEEMFYNDDLHTLADRFCLRLDSDEETEE